MRSRTESVLPVVVVVVVDRVDILGTGELVVWAETILVATGVRIRPMINGPRIAGPPEA